jgi:hypothetical protein
MHVVKKHPIVAINSESSFGTDKNTQNKSKQCFLILLDGTCLKSNGRINISAGGHTEIPEFRHKFLLKQIAPC